MNTGARALGLAISKSLVELMGGEIGMESELGHGSIFWFAVPLQEAKAPDQTSPDQDGVVDVSGGRILLVEDSLQNQDLVRTILERQGYEVHVANDGEEAIIAARSTRYELVLMDIQMPRMDGMTAARKIRGMEDPDSMLPIVALTANVLPEQLLSFPQAGINDHIAKPFRKPRLIAKVRDWIPGQTDPEESPPEAGELPVPHDRAAFDDLRDLMGDEWIRANLLRLRERIVETFGEGAEGPHDRQTLERHAHRIVANAGQMGLADLSRSCSALEEACAGEGDIARFLTAARCAARSARGTIEELLAETGATEEARSG